MKGEAPRSPQEAEAADGVRPCILSGEIRSTGTLCDVISFLAHASWWGELVVEHGPVLRSLYFDEGHVVAATSTDEGERIGEVLVKIGALTPSQSEQCREHAVASNLRFGEAVVELGFLTREKLFGLLGKQIEEIFCGIAAIESGSFIFLEGFDDADLAYRVRCSVDALLLDAIRRMDEKRYFEARIPTSEHVPARASDAPPPTSDPFGLFSAIDGTKSVAQLAVSAGIAELDVTRALFQHVHTGHASIKPPRLGAQKTIEVYNSAILVLLRELDALDRGDDVRAQLATFAASADSFFAAVKPADDGSLEVGPISALVGASSDPIAAEERLGKWLYDYASYAVFLARPHLARRDGERTSASGRVSKRVVALLDPIAPAGAPTLVVPSEPSAPSAPSAPEASPAPAVTTQRIRKTAIVPGLDPSRTVRMSRVTLQARVDPRGTRRIDAFVMPHERARRPAFVLPAAAESALATAAARPAAATTLAVDASQPPQRSPVAPVVVVAGVIVVLAFVFGMRAKVSDPPAAVTKASGLPPTTALVVACDPSCGSVFVDGVEAASKFEPVPVSAGAHDVVVLEKGFAQQMKRVDVADGQKVAVAFKLVAVPRGD
jgi:hypothetical protein